MTGWLTTAQAAERLFIARGTWQHVIGPRTDYMQIRRRLCGDNGSTNPQGQGWLWHAEDIETIRKIRMNAHCTIREALTVFRAWRLGQFDFLFDRGRPHCRGFP